jgi:heptaprenyl diphosphate synthase
MFSNNSDATHKEIVSKTTWILLAVAINTAEFFIPRIPFFPWLKPGLANCVTIAWIIEFGVADALLFTLLRIWIVGFYFGFSFITITLSFSGGICSTLVMGIAWRIAGRRGALGTIGTGIIGAFIHNCTQIVVIYFLLAKNTHIFYQAPLMLAASLVFGSITGGIAPTLLAFLQDARRIPVSVNPSLPENNIPYRHAVVSLALFCTGCIIVFIDSPVSLGFCALTSAIIVQALCGGSIRTLLLPFTRFWLLFLFIACVHLFMSYGTRISSLPFLTDQGIRLTGLQWLRLWTWLELSFILTYFQFHKVVLQGLRALFPRHLSTLYAGVLALEYFPSTLSAIRKKSKGRLSRLLRHPFSGMRIGMEHLYTEVVTLMSTPR